MAFHKGMPRHSIYKSWLSQIPSGGLQCHICELAIRSEQSLSGDHYPVPHATGGSLMLPSYTWCNMAHGANLDIKNPKYLEKLVIAWSKNGTRYNRRAIESIFSLYDIREKSGVCQGAGTLINSIKLLMSIPEEHRDARWENYADMFAGRLCGSVHEIMSEIAAGRRK